MIVPTCADDVDRLLHNIINRRGRFACGSYISLMLDNLNVSRQETFVLHLWCLDRVCTALQALPLAYEESFE